MNLRSFAAPRIGAAAVPLLASCVIHAGPTTAPAQPSAVEIIEADRSSPVPMAPGLADGKPPRLRPGTALAYWLWQGPSGNWHLRSTTSQQLHRFQGLIRPLQGATLGNVKATRLEWDDRVRLHGQDIVFDFSTQGGEDGFDFTLNGSACVEVDLRIDGAAHPKLVVIGKTEQAPPAGHFIVCP